MTLKIIVISHGEFSHAMVKSAQMIAGPQEGVYTFGLTPGYDTEKLKSEIAQTIENEVSKDEGLLVLTDLYFGTPFNIATSLMNDYRFLHITGINMSIYLEIVMIKDSGTLEDVAKIIDEKAKEVIINVNALLDEPMS